VLQLGARLERFDPSLLALYVAVGAVEKQRDEGADLIAQGRLGCRERRLGYEFIMLRAMLLARKVSWEC
jgi:hypothetical protein